MDNDFQIQDEDDFKNVELSIKQIALDHFNKCVAEGSKEMSKGGSVTKETRWGVFTVDIPNQQEIFRNHVDLMLIVMNPQIKERKPIKKRIDDIKDNINQIYKDCVTQINKSKQPTDDVKVINKKNIKVFNTKVMSEEYEKFLVEQHKKILVVVSDLLAEVNYFEEVSAY